MIKIGDWVKPKNGALPGPGLAIGRVVGEGTYSTLNIPAWLVDGGESKPRLTPKEAVEFWFTPEMP